MIEARRTLQTLVTSAPSVVLHELARTYDPHYLAQLSSIDDGSELKRAAELYQEAISYGATEAVGDLDRLRSTNPNFR